MFKKLAVLAAALAVSAPALADRGHHGSHGYYGQGHRYVKHYKVKHHYYQPAPRHVVHHYYYRPEPRPVYVVERHHYADPLAVLAGAVIGAAIVHHAVTPY